jgi:hypothetical protein
MSKVINMNLDVIAAIVCVYIYIYIYIELYAKIILDKHIILLSYEKPCTCIL